jgi:hypothetical protein
MSANLTEMREVTAEEMRTIEGGFGAAFYLTLMMATNEAAGRSPSDVAERYSNGVASLPPSQKP